LKRAIDMRHLNSSSSSSSSNSSSNSSNKHWLTAPQPHTNMTQHNGRNSRPQHCRPLPHRLSEKHWNFKADTSHTTCVCPWTRTPSTPLTTGNLNQPPSPHPTPGACPPLDSCLDAHGQIMAHCSKLCVPTTLPTCPAQASQPPAQPHCVHTQPTTRARAPVDCRLDACGHTVAHELEQRLTDAGATNNWRQVTLKALHGGTHLICIPRCDHSPAQQTAEGMGGAADTPVCYTSAAVNLICIP
jgi:hypothetical protein